MPDNPIKDVVSKAGGATVGAARGVRRKVFEEAYHQRTGKTPLPFEEVDGGALDE